MENGAVWIHRKIFDWEWWDDHNTARLFLVLLLKANWKDKKWRGQLIKRGSFITSYPHLAKDSGLSVQQVRTCVAKLEETQEINRRSTHQFTLITVKNYEQYQSKQQTDNRRVTDEQHLLNKDNKDNKVLLPKGSSTVDPFLLEELTNLEILMDKKNFPRKRTWGGDKAQRINLLLDYVEYKWGLEKLDDSEAKNRQWAFNLIRKYGAKTVMEVVEWIPTNEYWTGRATKMNVLWYNWEAIQREMKKKSVDEYQLKQAEIAKNL